MLYNDIKIRLFQAPDHSPCNGEMLLLWGGILGLPN